MQTSFQLSATGPNGSQVYPATCDHDTYPGGGEGWSYRVWHGTDFFFADIRVLDDQRVYVKTIDANLIPALMGRGIPEAIYRDVHRRSGRSVISSRRIHDNEFRSDWAERSWLGLQRRGNASYDVVEDRFTFMP
jgi:hypothetical protein